jgi:Na+/pantothenate symporter
MKLTNKALSIICLASSIASTYLGTIGGGGYFYLIGMGFIAISLVFFNEHLKDVGMRANLSRFKGVSNEK